MARVLLIHPIHAPARGPFPGIGLAYIAAALKAEGADVSCLDLNDRRPPPDDAEIARRLEACTFDVAAIGSMITSYAHVKRLCAMIKQLHPHATIWLGGSLVSPIPRMVMDDISPIDVGVIDEGDVTVRELYRAFVAGDSCAGIAGLVYREDGAILETPRRPTVKELDTLPLPDWEMYRMTGAGGYLTTHNLPMYLITHRGCPFECTYCYHERASRAHSVDRVVHEVSQAVERFGARRLTFGDDLFCAKRSWVHEVCERLIELNLGITWSATARANIVEPKMLEVMRRAGCVQLDMGFESASPTILHNIRKHLKPEQMSRALAMCRAAGIKPSVTFMIGNEGETPETVAESVAFMKRELITAPMFFTTPYPGTPVYERAREKGLIPDEFALFERYGEQALQLAVNLTDMPNEELIALRQQATREVRRHYDQHHYRRIVGERCAEARRMAVISAGYEAENLLQACGDGFDAIDVYSDRPAAASGAPETAIERRSLSELDANAYDAVMVADREVSDAVRVHLEQQGANGKVVHPYDDTYFLCKSL